ncbi:MAG: hypothetical protein ACREBW_05485 [Candidatus Micrarchaeaceae archaeon]
MASIDEKLKAFRLDDKQLQDAMRCAQLAKAAQEQPPHFVVETVVLRHGEVVVTRKEEANV